MHEFSLMQQVMEILRASAEEREVERIESIHMTVGVLSCAFPPALETAFAALARGDPLLEGARLHVEERDVLIRCRSCGEDAEIADPRFACPRCGERRVQVTAGDELVVNSYRGRARTGGGSVHGQGQSGAGRDAGQ